MAETTEIVAKLRISSVDATALGAAITKQISGATGLIRSAGGAGGAGGKSAAGELSPMFGKLFAPLAAANIVGGLIHDILKSIFGALQGVTKVWNTILLTISKMVEPFVNLLIPVLMPFLYLMSQVARILNMMLMPFFQAMMKASSKTIVNIAKEMGEGDLPGAIGAAVGGTLDTIAEGLTAGKTKEEGKGTAGTEEKKSAGTRLAETINASLAVAEDQVKQIDWGKAISDFIGSVFSGLFAFGNDLGKNLGDMIKKIDWLKLGSDIAIGIILFAPTLVSMILSPILAGLALVGGFINGLFLSLTGIDLAKLASDLITSIAVFSKAILDLIAKGAANVSKIWEFLSKAFEGLMLLLTAIFEGIRTKFNEVGKSLKESVESAFKQLIGWINGMIESAKKIVDSFVALIPKIDLGGGTTHQDFLMRPGQGATAFSPNDTIIGVKDPSSLMGGGRGGNTYIINASSIEMNTLAQIIRREIENTDAGNSRYGYYQKGF